MVRHVRFWIVLLGVFWASAVGRTQTPPDNDLCLACHGDPAAVRESGGSIAVDPARYEASSHGAMGFTCVTCHTDLASVSEFPHAAKLARVQCATCHDSAAEAYGKSIHAAARRANGASDAATCTDCHTAHDIRPATDPQSRTYPLNLPATCGRCHGNADIIKQDHIAIGNVAALYRDSIHGKAVSVSGLLVAANCTSCHGNHDIRRKNDPESKVFRANVPSTCGRCHEGIKTLYMEGIHGTELAAGNAKVPVCADCHTAHQIQRVDVTSWRLDVIRECGTCHASKIETYRDTFHGQVTSLGFVRVATCSDCHGPHRIFPKSDSRSMVSDEHRLETCQKCHAGATARFAQYDPHADESDRERNPSLFFAALGMKWLLIGVFTFFGLHTLLWLPRATLERRRRSQGVPPGPTTPSNGSR
jgi:nitrate/TMAO reductase-like tetraheme cytochrome c subunit